MLIAFFNIENAISTSIITTHSKTQANMSKINEHNSTSLMGGIYRVLFLLFLVVFLVYPIADARSDAYPDYFNDANVVNDMEDDHNSFHALNPLSQDHHANLISLLSLNLLIDGSMCHVERKETQVFDLKSSHACFPLLSSDVSPPSV